MSFFRFFRTLRLPRFSGEGNPSFLERLVDGCLLVLALLIPAWFLPVTLDPLDIQKQMLFVGLTLVALLAWIGRGALAGSFSVIRSRLSLVLLLFLGGYGVAAWFSQDRYASFVGLSGQMQWSFVSMASFVIFAFLLANRFRGRAKILQALRWFLVGGGVALLYGGLQLLGLPIFSGAFGARTFNTIGTVNALGIFAVILMSVSLSCLLLGEGKPSRWWTVLLSVVLAIGAVVLLAVDYAPAWIALLFAVVLVMGIPFMARRRFARPVLLVVPALLALLSVAFLWLSSPLMAPVPAEVSPSFSGTWDIAWQTLRDRPLVGSGPGTWAFDYARYRSSDVNASPFWSVLFDQGSSTVFTLIATMGVVGTVVALLLFLFTLLQSAPRVIRARDTDLWDIQMVVFVGWSTTAFLAFLSSHAFVHQFGFWLFFGLLMGLLAQEVRTWTRSHSPGVFTVLSTLSLLLVVGVVALFWLGTQRYVAEVVHAQGVRSFSAETPSWDEGIDQLAQAASLNPFFDQYPRALAQAHLAVVGGLLADTSVSEQDRSSAIQAHVASAFSAADAAIQRNPQSSVNWAHAGGVYAALARIAPDADTEAIYRYQEALMRHPNQPAFLNAIGQMFLFRADAITQSMESIDSTQREQAVSAKNTALQKGEQALLRAIQAKPDFVAAQMNLAVLYDRTGAFDSAIALLTAFLESTPDAADARLMLADVYTHAQKYDDAIAQLQLLADAYPDEAMISERMQQVRDAQAGQSSAMEGEVSPSSEPGMIPAATP